MPLQKDKLEALQVASKAARDFCPVLVKRDDGEVGQVNDDGTINYDTDELFNNIRDTREAIIEFDDIIQAEEARKTS